MILSNFHTHSTYCDGKMAIEDYILRAIELGFSAIGFSSHAPLPWDSFWCMKPERMPDYLAEVRMLQARWKDKIEVYLGLEIDYLHGLQGPRSPLFAKLGLDYCIGSVHSMKNPNTKAWREVDASTEVYQAMLAEDFGGDQESFMAAYFQYYAEMAREHKPDILGHFDLMKKNNRNNQFFNEDAAWYHRMVEKTVRAIAPTGCIVEINTGGIARNKTDSVYPSPWILALMHKEGIPIVINDDAHHPGQLASCRDIAVREARDAGYREAMTLSGGRWKVFPLDR